MAEREATDVSLFSDAESDSASAQAQQSSSAEVQQVLRFTRLRLAYWRNFKFVDVELQERAFLVGPNASGKSNLLEALRFLRDVAAEDVGFKAAVDRRGGLARIRSLAATRNTTVVVQVDIGTTAQPDLWRYELAFDDDSEGHPVVAREVVHASGATLLERPDAEDRVDPLRLRQPFLQQLTANRGFREVADFLQSVRYLHIVPQLVRDPDRTQGKKEDPYGGDFLDQVGARGKRDRDARLRKIEQALHAVVPQLSKLNFEEKGPGRKHLMARYDHWRSQAAWQTEEQLSDGTLRMIGLLWALLEGDGPLLLEEPELSLHPAIVRLLPMLFAQLQQPEGRQILVSTHSPELIAEEGIGLDEVLLLKPAAEGTLVRPAKELAEVQALLSAG